MRILQINTNRSRQAIDLALATANNLNTDVLIVSEPNISAVRNRKDWICDEHTKAAIKILNVDIRIKGQGDGKGFSYVATSKLTIFSCYCSGNDEIEELEETLQQIELHLQVHNEEAIIAGDFNAKSPQWGMNLTDARGQIIADWIATNDLVVNNKGSKPTFTHQNYGSILDLTLTTVKVASHIENWDVLEIESLSDHKYIMFDVQEKRQLNEIIPQMQRWQVRKLNHQKLQEAADNLGEPGNSTDFSKTLRHICKKVMPTKKKGKCRRPAYWWNEEISQLRSECLKKRREYTRNARRRPLSENRILWENYKESKRILRNSIKRAKRECWKTLCENVDSDIWGDGYKIVMKATGGFPPRGNLSRDFMENIVRHLFPTHNNVIFDCDSSNRFIDFTCDEIISACTKLKNNKAPGPGNIPAEVIKAVAKQNPNYVMSVYNELAKNSIFPAKWKVAKLVLLRKGNKPLENPSSFRPICLLDVEGKLYEHLLLERLNKEIERTGGLSENQYGFRKGRQTIDAIGKVLNIARQAAVKRDLCVAITLDVKNAFNSASWQQILDKMRRNGINESLIRIISSYLSDRKLLLETEEGAKLMNINSGVPQGSVIGPTLWNFIYDDILLTEMPTGVTLVGFADDVVMTATSKSELLLTNLANRGLLRVANSMDNLSLKLAPEKTEAVLLTRRRKLRPITFELRGNTITLSKAVKYLGVWLDTKLNFAEHVNQTVAKVERTTTALAKLMPNIGGPRASKRKILSSVAHSQLLYGAPVWHTVVQNQKLLKELTRSQRRMTLRICSAYRTVSAEGSCVIAGIPPIELQIEERNERYTGVAKDVAKENLARRWQEKWDNGVHGRWTYRLIPNVQRWIKRPYGEVDYFLTQALTGHGCFSRYLYDRRRSTTFDCPYCNDDDDVEHTLFFCPKWEEARGTYFSERGKIFTEAHMAEDLVANEVAWKCVYKTVRNIIETKEKEARSRIPH